MINLKAIPKRNPQVPEEVPKLYASAIHESKIELDGLAIAVAQRCSLRRADVHGVLVALMDLIPDELLQGNIISLGELGSFYATISSEGVDTEEELSVSMVKGSKIQYRPTKVLRNKLKMLDFKFVVDV
jgi:predicted histone-like DNA-binding protein